MFNWKIIFSLREAISGWTDKVICSGRIAQKKSTLAKNLTKFCENKPIMT